MPKETIARRSEQDERGGAVLEERTEELSVIWNISAEIVQTMLKWTSASDETGESHERYSPPLSRHEINRMIRALRKARDQAFGADA